MIRAATINDAAAICGIYNHHVLHTSVTFEEQPVDIHAMTAAVLLEKFLGPSTIQSQDELVSAEGTLKRADAAQRPSNRTWHGAYNFNAFASQSDTIRQVSLGVQGC